MKPPIILSFLLGIGLLLSACGNSTPGSTYTTRAMTLLPGAKQDKYSAEFQRLVTAGAPRVVFRMLDHDISSILLASGERDGVTNWREADNNRIYTDHGLLIGTRGMSFDLLTADTGEVLSLLQNERAGRAVRIHRLLDGNDNIRIRSYICDIVPIGPEPVIFFSENDAVTTQRLDEVCYGQDDSFVNHYWIKDRRIIQTVQTPSSGIGRVQLLFLP